MTLKVKVAQNLNHPLRSEIKESALMLEDMLRSLEKGNTNLTPRTRHRIHLAQPISKSGQPINKAMAIKN